MPEFPFYCKVCNEVHVFRHPSVSTLEAFQKITFTCQCGVEVKVYTKDSFQTDEGEISVVVPMSEWMIFSLEEQGYKVDPDKLAFIELR